MVTDSSDSTFSLGDFAVIKVMGKSKNSFRLYVVKVVEFDEDGYIGKFFKKSSYGFKFKESDEEALFKSPEDVIRRLTQPKMCSSSRFKGLITFDDDLDGLTIN